MYIVSLEDGKRKLSVAKPGLVKSLATIEKLRNKGILRVTIDLARCELPETPTVCKTVTLDKEMHRAKRVFKESKEIIGKVLQQVYQGQPLEIEPINEIADELVESLLSNSDAIHSLSALRTKDAYLLEHSLNVGVMLVSFGRSLGFDRNMLKKLMIGGIIHDIGKTQVDIDVLNKPARLSEEEFKHMQQHQVLSRPLLDAMPNLSPISRDISSMHHEKLDGTGYPDGLSGEQISLVGRIGSIVDIYDALTAVRVYKDGMCPSKAFKIMNTLIGFHLDGDLLKKFMLNIGLYPVGSLVQLNDGSAGLVWESNFENFKRPIVKTFYSTKYRGYRDVKFIDLAATKLTITKGLSLDEFPIDIADYRA